MRKHRRVLNSNNYKYMYICDSVVYITTDEAFRRWRRKKNFSKKKEKHLPIVIIIILSGLLTRGKLMPFYRQDMFQVDHIKATSNNHLYHRS